MSVSTIPVICYYNGQIVRTKTNVEYEGSKTFIAPLKIPVECTFQQLIDMIYSKTTIDKRRFKLVLICKYPLRNGNRFQPFPVRDDSSVCEMLNLVNTTTIEEIELYIKVVRVKAQLNQSVGGHVDLFVRDNYNVAQSDYSCGPSSGPVPDTGPNGDDEDSADEEGNNEYDEDVDEEGVGDYGDVEVDGHSSSFRLSTKFWRMNKGYTSLHKHHLVMYQITQMMIHWMSQPLLIITYHQHLNFNMLKTWIMLLQVVGLHGCSILPVI